MCNEPGTPKRAEGLFFLQRITAKDLKELKEPVLIRSQVTKETFAVLVPIGEYMQMQKEILERGLDG